MKRVLLERYSILPLLEALKDAKVRWAGEGAGSVEIAELLKRFKLLKDQYLKDHPEIMTTEDKDVNKLHKISFEEFRSKIEGWEKEYELKVKPLKKQAKREDVEIVFSNEFCDIYEVYTKPAMCKIGSDTDWCVTKSSHTHYENYTEGGSLFRVIITKIDITGKFGDRDYARKYKNEIDLSKIALEYKRRYDSDESEGIHLDVFDKRDNLMNMGGVLKIIRLLKIPVEYMYGAEDESAQVLDIVKEIEGGRRDRWVPRINQLISSIIRGTFDDRHLWSGEVWVKKGGISTDGKDIIVNTVPDLLKRIEKADFGGVYGEDRYEGMWELLRPKKLEEVLRGAKHYIKVRDTELIKEANLRGKSIVLVLSGELVTRYLLEEYGIHEYSLEILLPEEYEEAVERMRTFKEWFMEGGGTAAFNIDDYAGVRKDENGDIVIGEKLGENLENFIVDMFREVHMPGMVRISVRADVGNKVSRDARRGNRELLDNFIEEFKNDILDLEPKTISVEWFKELCDHRWGIFEFFNRDITEEDLDKYFYGSWKYYQTYLNSREVLGK